MTYQPRHKRSLPAIFNGPYFRGLADQIEPAGTRGYRARHARP